MGVLKARAVCPGRMVGRLAQLVERYVHIVEVTGSSPVATI